jgi:hypothetical protein
MSRLAIDTNPYAPPLANTIGPSPAFAMVSNEPPHSVRPRVFEVGVHERHTVTVSISIWTGEEIYLVDGVERKRTRSWWGRRTFSVGEKETHDIEVRVAPSGRVSVYVDRQLAERNLFPMLPWIPAALGAIVLGLIFMAAVIGVFPGGPAMLLRFL